MLSLDLFSYASAFQQQQSYLHQAIFIQAQIILKRIFVYLSFSYVLCFLSGLSFRLFWRKTRKWRRDIHSFWKSRRRYCPPYIFCRGYYPISCGHISCTSSWRSILVTCFPSYKERSCKHRAQILVYTTYNFVRCQIKKHDEKLPIEAILNLRGSLLHSELSADIKKISVYRKFLSRRISGLSTPQTVWETKKDWSLLDWVSNSNVPLEGVKRRNRERSEKREWAVRKGMVIDVLET